MVKPETELSKKKRNQAIIGASDTSLTPMKNQNQVNKEDSQKVSGKEKTGKKKKRNATKISVGDLDAELLGNPPDQHSPMSNNNIQLSHQHTS